MLGFLHKQICALLHTFTHTRTSTHTVMMCLPFGWWCWFWLNILACERAVAYVPSSYTDAWSVAGVCSRQSDGSFWPKLSRDKGLCYKWSPRDLPLCSFTPHLVSLKLPICYRICIDPACFPCWSWFDVVQDRRDCVFVASDRCQQCMQRHDLRLCIYVDGYVCMCTVMNTCVKPDAQFQNDQQYVSYPGCHAPLA